MTPIELDGSALNSSVAFTGRLACMTRAEAFEVVRQRGGTPSQAVTKRTKLLIVGELGWPLLDDGRLSNKLSRATAYGVPVVSERRFLEWIGKAVPDSVHKTYAADQLAALSKLSSDMIHELAQLGLLDERGGHFDFRDLAGARQIAMLQRTNQYAEAAHYWRRYLASDCQSEWAARARRSLKFCEMQVRLIGSPTGARLSPSSAAAPR